MFACRTLGLLISLTISATPALQGQISERGIWGTALDDVWVVGVDTAPVHFDGRTWSLLASAGTPLAGLQSVWGSGRNDVFFGGPNGTILRWNGQAVSRMAVPTQHRIIAIAGRSATSAYALTWNEIVGRSATLLQWDGTAWIDVIVPSSFGATALAVRGGELLVAGSFYADAIPGGRSPGALARLRETWTLSDRTTGGAGDSAVASAAWRHVLVSGDTAFLVGVRDRQMRAMIASSGTAWVALPPVPMDNADGDVKYAFMAGDGALVAFLDGGAGFAHRTAGEWTRVRPPDPYQPPAGLSREQLVLQSLAWNEADDVHAAWGVSAADFFIASGSGRVVRFRQNAAQVVYDASCREPAVAARSPTCRALASPQ